MKTIYIYSKHVANELELLQRVKNEYRGQLDAYELDEIPTMLRNYVRATPATIIVNDDLQGEHLLGEDVDGKLIVTGHLLKRTDDEDRFIHNVDNCRFDAYINEQKEAAKAELMTELQSSGAIIEEPVE